MIITKIKSFTDVDGTINKSALEELIKYIQNLNVYGEVIFAENTPIEILKQLSKFIDWKIEVNSSNINSILNFLKLGAKKVIIPQECISEVYKKISKEVIVVKLCMSNLLKYVHELDSLCSEYLLIDNNTKSISWKKKILIFNQIKKVTNKKITVSISDYSVDKFLTLEKLGFNSLIIPKDDLKEENLREYFLELLNFNKTDELIPTIVNDETNQILMLAYSSRESLHVACDLNRGVYYSRSRCNIWIKGETSGNSQDLIKIRYDCDRDTLLFTVLQKGNACHLSSYSCFGNKIFNISNLFTVLNEKIKDSDKNSYTWKLVNNEQLLLKKIKEESKEVINYENRDNLIWEIADLTYFILVLMKAKEISLQDIINELWKRRNYEK